MSNYLSPIASSGDLTPPNEESQLIRPQDSQPARPQADKRPEQQQQQQQTSSTTSSVLIDSLRQHSDQLRRLSAADDLTCDEEEDDLEDDDDDDVESDCELDLQGQRLRSMMMMSKTSKKTRGHQMSSNNQENCNYTYKKQNRHSAPTPPTQTTQTTTTRATTTTTTNDTSDQPEAKRRGLFGHNLNLRGQFMDSVRCSKTGDQLHQLFQSAQCPRNELKLNGKKLRQLIQSIPLVPLVATSLMTICILLLCFLLLSDTLQVARAAGEPDGHPLAGGGRHRAAIASLASRHMKHDNNNNNNQGEPQALVAAAAAPASATHDEQEAGGSKQVDQVKMRREAVSGASSSQADRPDDQWLPSKQLALKRELLENLMQQQQRHRSPKRHYPALQHQPTATESQQQQQADFESLGAMILGNSQAPDSSSSGDSEAPPSTQEPDIYLDGEPASSAYAPRQPDTSDLLVAGEELPIAGPAHLRSSEFKVDVGGGGESARPASHNQPHQQQQLFTFRQRAQAASQQMSGNNNNNNYRMQLRNNHNDHHQHNQLHRNSNNHNHNYNHNHQQQQQQATPSSSSSINQDRKFDVAQIQCNNTEEGFERFACPTPDNLGRYRCIEDRLFCDGYYDCPGREDEDVVSCMYYKLFVSHIDILTNTF